MEVACVGEAASSFISAGRHPPCNGVDWDAVSVRTTAKNCVADALHLFLRFAPAFNEFLKTTSAGAGAHVRRFERISGPGAWDLVRLRMG